MLASVASIGGDPNLSSNIESILSAVNTISTDIGASTDTVTTTIFGVLNTIDDGVEDLETLVGATGDTTSDTVFGELSKLTTIDENVGKAKSSAEAALGEAQGIRDEIGAKGKTPVVYEKIVRLENALKELKTATEAISESQVEASSLSSEILNTLADFVGESAAAVGLEVEGIEVKKVTKEEVITTKKLYEKLEEIMVKIQAIKESVEADEVVIKSYFESTE